MAFSLFQIIKGLLITEENTLTPKQIEITPGGTAGTKTTVVSSQTTNKTLTLPDATDTLVGKATTDVLTNKTIDADGTGNVISNIDDGNIKAGAAIDASKIADGSVSSTEFQYINSLTSNAQDQLTANATAISDHLADTTDAHDASAISFSATGTIAATDVQTAVAEVATDAASALSTHSGTATGVHGVTGNVVGTTDTQTLTNKTMSGASNTFTNIPAATAISGQLPIANGGTGQSTASAGFDALSPTTTKGDLIVRNSSTNTRLPVGTDGQVVVADSTQATGLKFSAITGVKNYITNEGAESTVSGWSAYADAAGTRPVDGTGGSPTVTITRTTTTPLRGTASLLITKDAANRQGQGVSYDFTIDSADKAKVLGVSFDYTVDSGTYSGGTSSTDSDLIVYLYDVTNATLIEPAPIKMDGGVSGVNYRYNGSFQTASNSTSYRLIIHCATTSASAYTIKYDNVVVGPQVVSVGGTVSFNGTNTSTQAVTANTTNITVTANKDSHSGWATNIYTVPIAGDYSVSIVSTDTATATAFRTYVNGSASNWVGGAAVNNYGGGTTLLTKLKAGDTIAVRSNTTGTLAANTNISIECSGVTQSSETDTRVVAARYYTTAGTSISSGVITLMDYATKSFDTHNAVTTGASWKYTAPVPGIYEVSGMFKFAVAAFSATSFTTLYLYKNGSIYSYLCLFRTENGAASLAPSESGSTTIELKAGDYIDFRIFQDHGSAKSLDADQYGNYVDIRRISGPSQIAASEFVSARVGKTGTQSVSNSTETVVTWNSVSHDTHSAYSTSTGLYTVPSAGYYVVKGLLEYAANSTGPRHLRLLKNGALEQILDYIEPAPAFTCVVSGASAPILCKAGDTLSISAYQVSGGSLNIAGDGVTYNWASFERVN